MKSKKWYGKKVVAGTIGLGFDTRSNKRQKGKGRIEGLPCCSALYLSIVRVMFDAVTPSDAAFRR